MPRLIVYSERLNKDNFLSSKIWSEISITLVWNYLSVSNIFTVEHNETGSSAFYLPTRKLMPKSTDRSCFNGNWARGTTRQVSKNAINAGTRTFMLSSYRPPEVAIALQALFTSCRSTDRRLIASYNDENLCKWQDDSSKIILTQVKNP